MKLEDVKKYYGTTYRFKKATGMHAINWSNWTKKGYIPILSQINIERVSNGVLKADLEHCK